MVILRATPHLVVPGDFCRTYSGHKMLTVLTIAATNAPFLRRTTHGTIITGVHEEDSVEDAFGPYTFLAIPSKAVRNHVIAFLRSTLERVLAIVLPLLPARWFAFPF